MAETDILNPVQGFWPQIGDNPNWNYGWQRKTNLNSQLGKARLGGWQQRDTANAGYAMELIWMERPWAAMLRLKQFYEDHKNGYFTLIDYDGGGRHHVGRFTAQPNPVQIANGKYNCQALTFEDIPQARMLQYPSNFAQWSRWIHVVDDNLVQLVAWSGHQLVGPGWSTVFNPGLVQPLSPTAPSSYVLRSGTNNAGFFAQAQYVGWGFQMTFPLVVTQGVCDVYLDGALIVQSLDLASGVSTATPAVPTCTPLAGTPTGVALPTSTALVTVNQGATKVTVQMTAVPLDQHRVKVVARGAAGAGSGTAVVFPPFQVIV